MLNQVKLKINNKKKKHCSKQKKTKKAIIKKNLTNIPTTKTKLKS